MIRTMAPVGLSNDIEEAHRLACLNKKSFYLDPNTGYQVFTSYHLSKRECCSSGCRHCPYRKTSGSATTSDTGPKYLCGNVDELEEENVDILFFSGGKDSFLTLRKLQRERKYPVILLTTFDESSRKIAHQGLHIDNDLIPQIKILNIPLLGVPLNSYCDYKQSLQNAIQFKILNQGFSVKRLVFGDLHLQHIKAWRDDYLTDLIQNHRMQLYYPLWHVPYDQLLDEITELSNGVVVRQVGAEESITIKVIFTVSAVEDEQAQYEGVKIGDVFDKNFVQRLSSQVDTFGEKGEFHTLARITTL